MVSRSPARTSASSGRTWPTTLSYHPVARIGSCLPVASRRGSEFPDATTVRYSWDTPNPSLPAALAGARPDYIFLPAHYLKQFHPAYTPLDTLKAMAKEQGAQLGSAVHEQGAALQERQPRPADAGTVG